MPTVVRHNKRDTIRRVDAEYRELDRAVRRLGTKGLAAEVPGFGARARIKRERWQRKDALAHIVEWKRQQLRALRREPSDPNLRGMRLHEKNRFFFRRWHPRSAREVVAYHREVGREIRTAMRALGPEYYAKRFSPLWPNDLIGHSAEHRRKHLEIREE
ncbi:MAG: hypothetical protein AUH85_13425 [Chloroflexi bacterium 13_1_40CM_4_68_4]|nr:MAG: hypothetical protein AUH85_13425 [Chloroflexi bacterium 13_1_40CM_4_68_4]